MHLRTWVILPRVVQDWYGNALPRGYVLHWQHRPQSHLFGAYSEGLRVSHRSIFIDWHAVYSLVRLYWWIGVYR